ncbi:MAG: hypothetical protein P1V51_19705 [Deltaproteobacteria bacterium]|nr:hypothetical protein [Deltaproteobacteria bacterium]
MLAPTAKMADLKFKYQACPIAETRDREWVDRLRTFEDFIANGPLAADGIRDSEPRDQAWIRSLAPDLHDLLLETFPEP